MNPSRPRKMAILLAGLLSVAAMVGMFVYDYTTTRAQQLDYGIKRITDFTQMFGEHSARTFDAVDVILIELRNLISTSPGWQQWSEQTGHELLMRRKTRALPQLRDFAVYDMMGKQRFHSSLFPAPVIDVSDRPYFKTLKGGADHVHWGPYKGRNSGIYTYAMNRRILNKDGDFDGVMFAAIEPAYFNTICVNSRIADDFQLALTTAEGKIIASCDPPEQIASGTSTVGQPVSDTLAGGRFASTWNQGSLQRRDGFLYLRHQVPNFPELFVFSAVSEKALLASWESRQRHVTLIVGITLLLILAGFGIVYRQFSQLAAAAQALSEHRDNLERRVKEATAELEEGKRRAEALAFLDGLTRVANRRRLDDVLGSEWRRAIRSGKPVGLIFIDIDHFKKYNDHFGHGQGDECLIQIAQTLAASMHRPCDLAGRYGGEEFLAVLPEVGTEGTLAVAERFRAAVLALALPAAPSSGTHIVTVSIGVASAVPQRDSTVTEFLKLADEALYRAKSEGRNRVEIAAPLSPPKGLVAG